MSVDSSETSSPESDELLDRAVDGLRTMSVPAGPSALLIERTRHRLAAEAAGLSRARRRMMLHPAILSLAAAVAILVTSIMVYRLAFHRTSPDVAKRDVHPRNEPVSPKLPPTVPVAPSNAPVLPAPKQDTPPARDPADSVYAVGVISGRVSFDGVAPPPAMLPGVNLMPECQKAHGGPIYDESLVVSPDGALANVVVSVSAGLSGWLREEFPPPATQAVLDQKGCVFEPHVVAIMVGDPLLIRNSDPFLHNVHVMAVNNPQANLGQPTMGEMATEPFESPEVFRVKCDVHPWMQAWVRVVDNPYFAVTGRDGRFTLHGLPPGTYTLKAWHEKLGVREMQVTIDPGRGSTADFTFKPLP